MRATERRTRLWLIVFRRREVTVAELAEQLHVSIRTIKYDLAGMIHFYPINTVRGRYGGCVKLQDCLPSMKGPLSCLNLLIQSRGVFKLRGQPFAVCDG